ncbi:hypothetical protein [Haloarchaeobius amylolyticus]|uniref:hypothetical protein n=1 Tax=Haloarchaeobius amylolyticus TaxID=1198296 RepID=UPI0022717F1B|nr:hypothetical protein [Haloarchaeobius amylolyticus]
MDRHLSRRAVLGGTSTLLGLASLGRRSRATPTTPPTRFDPATHGFGFRNWGTKSQYFAAPPTEPRGNLPERVRTGWRNHARALLGVQSISASTLLVEAIATQLRTAVTQRAGTNGHCYGMVLAAQSYFEDAGTIPVDREVASEIESPVVPVDTPETPVYDDIVRRQASQFLRLRVWLGRVPMVYPGWIDTTAVVRDIAASVRELGSAAVMVFTPGSLSAHQVLVSDVTETDGGVSMRVYDPNRPAWAYRHVEPTIEFEREDGRLVMQPYESGTTTYTQVLFNRHDRIERATDRDSATPLDHLTVEAETLREGALPLGLVLVDSDDVVLTVVDPAGEPGDRLRSPQMDRSRGEYARMRSLYGVAPGDYRIRVVGTDEATYGLRTLVADHETAIVDDARRAAIDPGEVHEYVLSVDDDRTGAVRRAGRGRLPPSVLGGAAAVGGLGVGAVGYRLLARDGR